MPGKREETQSIAVSEEERLVIQVIAKSEGIKPSTAARFLLYRGLESYINDRKIRAELHESEILPVLNGLIEATPRLAKAKELVQSEKTATSHSTSIKKKAS